MSHGSRIVEWVTDRPKPRHTRDTRFFQSSSRKYPRKYPRIQVYGLPKLLVLDGSLAAVDGAVARRIFDAVHRYVAADPTRAALIVLSQLYLLPECQKVIFLREGRVVTHGTHDDMLSSDLGRHFSAAARSSFFKTALRFFVSSSPLEKSKALFLSRESRTRRQKRPLSFNRIYEYTLMFFFERATKCRASSSSSRSCVSRFPCTE